MNIIFKIYIIYYSLINIVLFIMMGFDKYFAIKRKRRIRELNLFIISIFGGCIGGLLGMKVFNHKIRKYLFYLIYIFSFILHFILLYFIIILLK